jgi:hypothetical protein
MKFFAWLHDQEQGPFDEENIQTMISSGQIPNDTLLRLEDNDSDWIAAKDLFPQDSSGVQRLKLNEIDLVEIELNSGTKLKIKAIRLYDEIELAQINSKRAEASKKLQGVSTGLGSFGSIEWVLAASAVVGAVESVLSAGASSAGISLLREAVQAERRLRGQGILFPVNKILYIENPTPGFWRAQTAIAKITKAFVHNGDEFIVVQTDDDSVSLIRWSTVQRYAYSKSAI